MRIEIEQNEPESEILLVTDNKTDDVSTDESDKNALEGEIISETTGKIEEPDEPLTDEFAHFLANLPKDANASFKISRMPDRNLKGEFRQPCNVLKHIDTIYWNGEQEPEEIYAQITEKHGGGKYHFQIRQGLGFGKAWQQVLADPPFLTELEADLKEREEPKPPTAPVFQPVQTAEAPQPFDRRKFLADLIEEKKLENEIGQLFAPPQPTEQEPATAPKPSKMDFLISLYQSSKDEVQQKRVLNALLGVEENGAMVEPAWYESLAGKAVDMVANNPQLQTQLGQMASGIINLGTAMVAGKIAPAAAAPAAAPGIDLSAIKTPRTDTPPAPMPETAPKPPMQPVTPPAPLVPLIKLGDAAE